jgi:hypothetical protein
MIVLHDSPETDGLTDWQAVGLDADNLVIVSIAQLFCQDSNLVD